MTSTLATIPVAAIDPSPEQSRTDWGDLPALAAAIKESGGVTTRVKLVQAGKRYVLVDGERRVRATKLAGIAEIDAEIVTTTPRDAALDQVRANDGKPLTPIEEGRAFLRLRDVHAMTVAEIAKKLGRRESVIESRLRLTALHPEVQALFTAGRIGIASAALLAHTSLEVQEQAADDIARLHPVGSVTTRDVRALIDHRTHRISSAPFNPASDELTTSGACTSCPHNTATQRDLFDAIDDDATCLSAPCWEAKVAAHVALELDHATKHQVRVMDESEVALCFDAGRLRPGARWVAVDEPISELGEGDLREDGAPMTWRDLETQLAEADKDGQGWDMSKLAFAVSAGRTYYLLEADYAAGFIERTHPRRARELRGQPDPEVEEAKAERKAKKKLEADEAELLGAEMAALTAACDARIAALVSAADVDEDEQRPVAETARALVLLIGWLAGPAVMRVVAKRRALPLEEERDGSPISPYDAISRHVVDADFAGAYQLVVELVATASALDEKMPESALKALFKACGVDRAKVKRELERSKKGVTTRRGRKKAAEEGEVFA